MKLDMHNPASIALWRAVSDRLGLRLEAMEQ